VNGTIRSGRQKLWAHRDFRRLWTAQAVSAFGSRITRTVLPIVAINSLGALPLDVSILGTLSVAPAVAVGLFASGLIDRRSKRHALIAMDMARAALLLMLPAAALLGLLAIWQLWLVAALMGAATAAFRMADTAYLPRLVESEQILEGNTKLQTTEAIAEIGGPGVAGVLIQTITAPAAIIVDALSFLWSAWWLWRIVAREEPTIEEAPRHPLADIAVGWRACLVHPLMRLLLLAQMLWLVLGGFFVALYMIFLLRDLALGEAIVGVIIGAGGVGALWGALIAGPMSRQFGYGPALVVCAGGWIAATACVPLAQGAGALTLPLLFAQQLLGDGFLAAFMILQVNMQQALLAPEIQARVAAVFHIAEGVALPAGAFIAASLANALGIMHTLWVAVCGALIGVVFLGFSKLWALRELPVTVFAGDIARLT
jgi:predicted MFS family arabinose efflux permease